MIPHVAGASFRSRDRTFYRCYLQSDVCSDRSPWLLYARSRRLCFGGRNWTSSAECCERISPTASSRDGTHGVSLSRSPPLSHSGGPCPADGILVRVGAAVSIAGRVTRNVVPAPTLLE